MKWPTIRAAHTTVYHGDWGHRRWHRWKKSIWAAAGIFIIIFSLSWAVKDRIFTVKRVEIVQQVAVSPDVMPMTDIQNYANRQAGTWLWLKRQGFAAGLLKKYPSVRQAEVVVHFPDTLEIDLLPRVALCQLVTPSGTFLADRSGFVFARLSQAAQKLPQIKTNKQPEIGSTVSSQGLTLSLSLITGLRANQPPLQGIDLHDGQLDVRLDGPPLIMVSEDAQADVVLAQIKALMDKFNNEHRFPQQLDMRFERPVIRY